MAYSTAAVLFVLASFAAAASAAFFGGASSVNQLEPVLIGGYRGAGKALIGAYSSIGSGLGITQFTTGALQIAASDAPMTAAQDRAAGAKFTLPQVVGTYSFFIRNKAGLKLTAAQSYKIYSGQIAFWSQIPGSGLTGKIVPVARADSSGTTEVVTKYWQAARVGIPFSKVGTGPFKFGNPAQVSISGGSGLAAYVASHPGSIGYAQTGVGKSFKNFEVAVSNSAGIYVVASATDPSQAIPRSLPPSAASWSGVSLVFTRGRNTYPITSFVYLFVKQRYASAAISGAVKGFTTYLNGASAQSAVSRYYFSPIPVAIRNKNIAAIKLIKP